MTTGWALERGAQLQPDGTVGFAVWAPRAPAVAVQVTSQGAAGTDLDRGADGVHRAEIRGLAPGDEYVLRLGPGRGRPDPVSRWQPHGVHGATRIVDPTAFRWTDASWRGYPLEELVLYELHVGTFTEAGTFDAVTERLPYLRELGVTALELMPVAQFPGGRNWGYDGVHPYAAQSTYGGPAGLKRLVDAAHGEGLAVLLDVVYNHLGPEGNYLAEFGPYFTDRYRTPWGQAVNFDGPDSDEVRRYFVDNALYWITECHLDGLRLDAVHAIFDFGARHFLAELADAVHAQAALLKRRVHVIAESDLNDPRLVRTSDRGGYGLDGQWNEDFHHAVHAALTGERQAYYCDFGGVDQVAAVLERNFTLDGRYSAHRRRRHGMPAADVPPHRFVVFLQNHDQVGNRARGDRFAEIVPLPARRLGAALTLLAPSVPLLFMGEEYGETRPFLYFTSHADQALVEAVRQGRREEFAAFGWTEQPPDPQSEATFRRSRLSWDVEDDPARRHLGRLYRDLLAVRRAEPTLRAAEVQRHVLHGPPGWIAVRMESGGRAALLAVFNLADVETTLGAAPPGQWRLRLSTEAEAYGGAGTECPATLHGDAGDGLTLAPHSAALFRQEVT